MTIPMVPEIEAFLQAMTPGSKVKPERYEEETIQDPRLAADESGQRIVYPEMLLGFRSDLGIGLNAVVRKVTGELEKRGHLTDRKLVLHLLRCVAVVRTLFSSATDALNAIIATAAPTELSTAYVLPLRLPHHVDLGTVSFGRFDYESWAAKGRRAGTDYFPRNEKVLRGNSAVTWHPRTVVVLSLNLPPQPIALATQENKNLYAFWEHATTMYFMCLAGIFFERQWGLFREAQELVVGAGAEGCPDTVLRRGSGGGSAICLFEKIGGHNLGWVSPILEQPTVTYGRFDITINRCKEQLASQFGVALPFDEVGEHASTIRTYARFLSKAEAHRKEGRPDESFLHFVIALDLVFGEKDRPTESISDRVAITTYREMKRAYPEQVKAVKNLYQLRSDYVHAGESVPEERIDEVQSLCRAALRTLLRARPLPPDSASKGRFHRWLLKLDHFATGMEAGMPVLATQLQEAGLLPSEREDRARD